MQSGAVIVSLTVMDRTDLRKYSCVLFEVRMFCFFHLWESNLNLAPFPQVLNLMPTSLLIHFTVFLCGGTQFLQYL